MFESKILLEDKINKIEKIMQTDNALSNQQLIYCNRLSESCLDDTINEDQN